ncbi:MAG: deoxyuridine 5'-triphosphate nucleotidohydrolase [Firmicutes bacterium]|nr:deoxyuridine 5'-triphosphate nucleotidohydrolase [Bacillota bacterium]
MEKVTIKIKYFSEDAERLTYIDGKSDWIDLRAAKRMDLKAWEQYFVPLGVAMELPKCYEAHILPRSSAFKNYGILQPNSMGIVDNTYCGPDDQWHMPVLATRDAVIEKGDRIAQFRIMENQPPIEFEESDLAGNITRGGFGSTGRK